MLKKIAVSAGIAATCCAIALACLTITACPQANPAGCAPPKIDCAKGMIGVAVTPTVRLGSGTVSTVNLVLTVTCGGVPVPNAQVCIAYPGGKTAMSGATDNAGMVKMNANFPADVTGQAATAVATGSDGAATFPFKL
jgi:hypothetical protein